MEEEIILSQIIEDAQKEATRIRQEAESLAKKIEEENTEKARKEMQEKFEIIKAKIKFLIQRLCMALRFF